MSCIRNHPYFHNSIQRTEAEEIIYETHTPILRHSSIDRNLFALSYLHSNNTVCHILLYPGPNNSVYHVSEYGSIYNTYESIHSLLTIVYPSYSMNIHSSLQSDIDIDPIYVTSLTSDYDPCA